jgi:hypothetical protein
MTELPVLHTSERSLSKRCPQAWWWKYVEHLQSTGAQADALWFGIGVHEALAVWYKKGKRRGVHPAKTFAEWAGEEVAYAKTWLDEEFEESKWEDATELGIGMLENYVDHYGKDPQWEVIAVEQPFAVTVKRGGEGVAVFRSRWDGVIRDLDDGQVYLLEHKTANQISTAYLELDDQAGAYWAVAGPVLRAKGILKPDEEIAGIQYNFLRKIMPDDRPQNEFGEYLNKNGDVSKNQGAPRFVRPEPLERSPRERAVQMGRLADEVAVMNAMKTGVIPVVKKTSRDCPRCEFYAMCIAHERGGSGYQSIRKALYTEVDPYEDDAKSAAW